MAAPPIRRKTKRKSESRVRKYWWLVPVFGFVGMIGWVATGPRWTRAPLSTRVAKPIVGYVASTPIMTQEYAHFYGKPLNNPGIEQAFDQANQRVKGEDYVNAVELLEQVSKVAAVPVVFNNLGVLYAELYDTSKAINAFREALARDIDYPAVRSNLKRLKDVIALGADPVTREVEPNDNAALANTIAPGKAVEGEIDSAFNDVDYFRVTTPPAPRDTISIEIANRSAKLVPALKIFDAEGRITGWGKVAAQPGSSLQQTIAPAPNTTLYLEVSGHDGSAGAYTLLVRPMKLFDADAQ